MSRLTRTVATTAAIVLVASAAVAVAPAASAGTCTGRFCGAVKNRTGKTMHYTRDLGKATADGWCDVWNWDGGPGSSFHHAQCSQKPLGNGMMGGNTTGIDVDAFTFNNEGYHERFSRVGRWHWRQKGVWTKIRDGEIADCGIGASNEIWCTLLWQAW